MQVHLMVNGELPVLRTLPRAGRIGIFLSLGLGLLGFQSAGLNLRTRLLPLQHRDLIPQLLIGLFELPDTIQQLPNHPQQRLNH